MGQQQAARIWGIDLLRVCAVGLVLLVHAQQVLAPAPGPVDSFLRTGWIGVDLFFVLSGFLIGSQAFSGRMGIREFWVRRWTRTLPLYYAVFLFYAFVKPALLHFPFRGDTRMFWLFLQNFGRLGDFGQSWSLCVEEQFYFFLPLLVIGLGIRRKSAVAALWLLSPLLRAILWQRLGGAPGVKGLDVEDYDLYFRFNSLSHLDGLAAGLFLSQTQGSWKAWPVGLRRALGGFGLLLAFGVALDSLYTPADARIVFTLSVLSIGFSLALLGFCDLPRPGRGFGLVVEKVALWSYGSYLWNVVVMRAMAQRPDSWPWIPGFVVFVGGTFTLAVATYHLIEKPGMRLRRRLLPGRSSGPSGS